MIKIFQLFLVITLFVTSSHAKDKNSIVERVGNEIGGTCGNLASQGAMSYILKNYGTSESRNKIEEFYGMIVENYKNEKCDSTKWIYAMVRTKEEIRKEQNGYKVN